MAMRVRWTSYGQAAARALHDEVAAAKAGEPLAPVTVVVPSNHVGVASRRLLSSGSLGPSPAGGGPGRRHVRHDVPAGGAARRRHAGRAGQEAGVHAGAGGRHAGRAGGRPRALRARRRAPGHRVGAASAPTGSCATCPPAPSTPSPRPATGPGEVVRLHRAVRARLEGQWSDEEDLLTAATALAGTAGGRARRARRPPPPAAVPAQRPPAGGAGRATSPRR